MSPTPIIAIDGPAASGKGTLAKHLSSDLGFDHLDTGSLYRAVGRLLLDAGSDPSDPELAAAAARALRPEDLKRSDLRGEIVASAASKCSCVPAVRAALLDFQLDFAANPPGGLGAVLDGRDIGTAVCPNATVKIWIHASPRARAERRHAETIQSGDLSQTVESIEAAISVRDERERSRASSPLIPASDALMIDTSELRPEEVYLAARNYIDPRLADAQPSLGSRAKP